MANYKENSFLIELYLQFILYFRTQKERNKKMDYFMASKILFSNYKMLFLFMTCSDILINCLDLHFIFAYVVLFSQLIIYSYRIPKLYLKIHYGHTTVFSNLSSGLPFYLQTQTVRNVIAVYSHRAMLMCERGS